MLKINQQAPSFSIKDSYGKEVNIGGKSDRMTLLYFYPKDDTSGCTIQANDFTSLKTSFDELSIDVFGVNKNDAETHKNFINKFNLSINLLIDPDGSVCKAYGTWGEKEKNGVVKLGIIRSTFLIDKAGHLNYVEYKVSAPDHAKKLLTFVRNLNN